MNKDIVIVDGPLEGEVVCIEHTAYKCTLLVGTDYMDYYRKGFVRTNASSHPGWYGILSIDQFNKSGIPIEAKILKHLDIIIKIGITTPISNELSYTRTTK